MSKFTVYRGVLRPEWQGLPMVSRVLWCWYLHQVMITCWRDKGGKEGFRAWLDSIGGKVEVMDMSYSTFPSGYKVSASVWYHRMAELKKAGVVGDGWILYPSEFVDDGFFELEMIGDTVLSRFGVASVLYSMLYRTADYRKAAMVRVNTRVLSNALGLSQEMCWKYLRFLEDRGYVTKEFVPRYGTYTCVEALARKYGRCFPDTDQPLRRFRVKDGGVAVGDFVGEDEWSDPTPPPSKKRGRKPKVKKEVEVVKPQVNYEFEDENLPF